MRWCLLLPSQGSPEEEGESRSPLDLTLSKWASRLSPSTQNQTRNQKEKGGKERTTRPADLTGPSAQTKIRSDHSSNLIVSSNETTPPHRLPLTTNYIQFIFLCQNGHIQAIRYNTIFILFRPIYSFKFNQNRNYRL